MSGSVRDEMARSLELSTADLPVIGPRTGLASSLPVLDLALASVLTAAAAARQLAAARGLSTPSFAVEPAGVALAFTSERHFRVDGVAGNAWAPLSRFFSTADGWVRLHGNYPHHVAAISRALGCAPEADDVSRAVARHPASEVAERIVAAGGVAAAVQTEAQWRAHPQGRALAARPLVELAGAGGAPRLPKPTGPLAASGLRVLDLTRVIAGPVAGRTLAAWGADVLRVDPPTLPEIPLQYLETGWGKRSTLLDLGTPDGRERLLRLASGAHVVLTGYRPGAVAARGLGAADLLAVNRGLVVVELSAWGQYGPWGGRRGFDSIVQAATGIADVTSAGGGRPGVLPAQALDHATGYLAAAAGLALLAQRRGGSVVRLSLARAAQLLLDDPRPAVVSDAGEPDAEEADADETALRWLAERDTPHGWLRYARPPFLLGGEPLDYPRAAGRYGGAAAEWPSE